MGDSFVNSFLEKMYREELSIDSAIKLAMEALFKSSMGERLLVIRGARQHNPKNIRCYQKADTSLATGSAF
jgi:hypothetical protein